MCAHRIKKYSLLFHSMTWHQTGDKREGSPVTTFSRPLQGHLCPSSPMATFSMSPPYSFSLALPILACTD